MLRFKRLVSLALVAIGVLALKEQTDRPPSESTWHGRICGVPYEFRRPTLARMRQRLWNPDDPRVFVPHVWGVGWTINLNAAAHRLGLIRDS
ncbi:MAG: DUF5808 domain-containing protein [Thermomicrobiales bacterium]|nr:DUF5808 domain-containing protein [Thermomicrobiales bacterium]